MVFSWRIFIPSFKALIPDPFGCYKTQSKNKQSNRNYKTINPNKWGLDSLEYYLLLQNQHEIVLDPFVLLGPQWFL